MPNQPISSIVFRADGNSQIGLGHVMRCLAIADMIGHTYTLLFAIQQPSVQVSHLLQQASIHVISLPETTNYQSDATNFVSYLSGSEIVVLDGYSFNADYQKTVKQYCGKLLAIDDLVAWHQYADVVINHGGNAKSDIYKAEAYTSFLLGTHYALLRRPFLEAGKKRPINLLTTFHPQRILVNLGGADPENVTHHIVDLLVKKSTINQIVVILGAANPHNDSFSEYTGQNVQVYLALTPEQMVTEIQVCDIAIVSCSTISYEVATIGKPFIGILTADNQLSLRDFYTTNQIALRVLDKDFAADDLISILSETVSTANNTLINQQHFFDGKSGERIADFFRTLH